MVFSNLLRIHSSKISSQVKLIRDQPTKHGFHHTLFIAAIALLAPFIPADIEVPAYIALTNR
jgi:hypothetical protein